MDGKALSMDHLVGVFSQVHINVKAGVSPIPRHFNKQIIECEKITCTDIMSHYDENFIL